MIKTIRLIAVASVFALVGISYVTADCGSCGTHKKEKAACDTKDAKSCSDKKSECKDKAKCDKDKAKCAAECKDKKDCAKDKTEGATKESSTTEGATKESAATEGAPSEG